MAIRLSKAIKELNIGLQTAVEFLTKKYDLGDAKIDQNFKLNDDHYESLVEEFKSDKEVRTQAEKIFPKKPKEKKRPEPESHKAETLLESSRPQFKPLGKIDLDSLNKRPAAPTPSAEPKKESPTPAPAVAEVEKAAPQPAVPSPQPEEKKAEQPKEEVRQEPAAPEVKKPAEPEKPAVESKPEVAAAPVAQQQPAETTSEKPLEEPKAPVADQKIFTLESEQKNAPKVNVLGKIDLDSLNQSTRPKKKTKEEKRKEREEKSQHGTAQGGEKKKRVRINKERVDINAASKDVPSGNQGGGNQGGGKNKNKKDKNRKRNQRPLEVNEEDVARQVKETLARLTNKNQNKKGAKYRKEKREAIQERLQEERAEQKAESKVLKLTEFVTVSELATMMNVGVNQVIGTCMSIGIMVSINQRLDAETINIVADEFGFTTEYVSAEVQNAITEEDDDENDLVPRAPIVTVMGHVDHGKTSLLDHIRNTNVIAGEAGGITQHIGAYNVKLKDGRRITFLDTPGHEAFTAMRARGAQMTDLAIIIVAADDAVMPQTKEAIAHAQAAGVPMVFAINKIDKPGANPDTIRRQLSEMNILVEDWGGKYQCQEISAKKGIGVDKLLEKVLFETDLLELKANPNKMGSGAVIESSLDKGRGYLATVLVQDGTVHVGDVIISGSYYGRVKAMFNERGQKVESAGPSTPVSLLGLNGAPAAGEKFNIMADEKEAKSIAQRREQLIRIQGIKTQKHLTLEEIGRRIAIGNFKELNVIVKGDVDGSVEALSDSLIKLSTEETASTRSRKVSRVCWSRRRRKRSPLPRRSSRPSRSPRLEPSPAAL